MKRHRQMFQKFWGVIFFLALSPAAWAYDFYTGGINYTILSSDDKTVAVTSISPSGGDYSGDVVIPATVMNEGIEYRVIAIGYRAFFQCRNLTWVTIPEGVTTIDKMAFSGCSGLPSVTIGKNVANIGDGAFAGCSSLTSITIPNSVTAIGKKAFEMCEGLTSVTIGEGVTAIGEAAFVGCSHLTEFKGKFAVDNCCLIVNDTLKAFAPNSGLSEYTIPYDVKVIGSDAFYNCTCLTSVTIPENVTSIDYRAFYGCSGLTSVTIGEGVTTIGKWAFSGCSGLTSVTIPESVTSIDESAFLSCWGLMSVTIGKNVANIGDGAFAGCSSLTSITIPNSVTVIGKITFSSCSGLTEVTIGEGVIAIGDNAFMYCRGLTSVTIPESVQTIGDEVFYGCSGLTEFKGKFTVDNCCLIVNDTLKAFAPNSDQSEYIISDDVKVIGESAFLGCSGLTSVTIPESVTSIDESAFLSCSGLTSVTIGEGVTAIGKSAFSGCEGLEKFEGKWASEDNRCLIVNDTLRFFAPSGLTQYIIPDGVTTIGESAFASCLDLTSVTIPKSVTYIGGDAFYECYGLTSVTAYNPTPVDISTVFYRVDCSNCTLYVPAESVEKYKKAEGWSEFGEILPINESSAITETQQEQAGITVYNLQGVPVLETDDAADLKTLQNGAYIVNGKTMIIVR